MTRRVVVMPGLVDLHFHTDIERGGYSECARVEEALSSTGTR